MREIKFRGKSVDDDTWIYGSYQADVMLMNKHTIIYSDYEGFYCEDEVDPETVGQFTGLHDKNGVEIYEGDVIENAADDAHEVVTFDEGSFWLEGSTYTTPLHEVNTEAEEVIGNIHEDPHLLERD